MPEKQAKGFGQLEAEQTFVLGLKKEENGQMAGNGLKPSPAARPQQSEGLSTEKPAEGIADLLNMGPMPPEGDKQTVNGTTEKKHLVLNISQTASRKILLRQKASYVRLTGNPFIDMYRRINDFLVDHAKISVRDKATFFRLLAVMINAGIPLIKSLKTLGIQSEKSPKLARTLFEMAQMIESGKSLSESMGMFPVIFHEAQVGMVHAGEASGQLNRTLRDLADDVEKSASMAGKIKGALIYPVAILGLLAVVIFLMMVLVVPQLTKLFSQTGKDLPVVTQILINASNFSVNYWPVIILAVFGMLFGLGIWKKTRNGHYMWDLMLLKLPIFGSLIEKSVLSRFARGISSLLSSGVPIIKSIEIVANAVGSEVYRRKLYLTAQDMKGGIPMAENMADSKLFPAMLVNMIEVGEQTAQLENVMLKVAQFYDEEVDNVVKALAKVMEPLILVIIGTTVGGLVAAIMLPIIQLTNVSGGLS